MSFFYGIQGQLLVRFMSVLTFILVVFGFVNYKARQVELSTALNEQAQSALARMVTSLPEPMWNFDTASTAKIIEAEMAPPGFTGIIVRNNDAVLDGRVKI